MEDLALYDNKPSQSYIVYKLEVNPTNPKVSRVFTWQTPTFNKALKLMPSGYKQCYDFKIRFKDYYLVVQLKEGEDKTCLYFVNHEK